MRKKTNRKRNLRALKRTQPTRHAYDTLEDRRLLATLTSLDVGTGQLTITLTEANDLASVDVEAGQVTVNGSNDVDSGTPDTQTLNLADLRSLVIVGDSSLSGQTVQLRGDFDSSSGADIQTVSITDVNSVFVIGIYEMSGDFSATLDTNRGGIHDGQTGRLMVGGETKIVANDNPIVLNNMNNDFVGPVSLQAGPFGYSAWIADANNIEFSQISIANDFRATAGGDISDTDDANIQVGDWGSFVGSSIAFGNNSSGTTEISRLTVNSPGHVELYFDSSVLFVGLNNMGSLDVDTDQGIHDGSRKTAVRVTGLATLRGDTAIELGDASGDIFHAGSINFNSSGAVNLTENSGMRIAGSNTARTMNLTASGDIVDADDAAINIEFASRFTADNIYIGDTTMDEFNSSWISFNTPGDMFLTEDSGIHIIENNQANRLELETNGFISDSIDSSINVVTVSKFIATAATLGETDTDNFTSGQLTFQVVNRFQIFEDDATQFAGINFAQTATIVSAQDMTNAELTRIFVAGNASFTGSQILIGNQFNDLMLFGGLLLNSTGSATIFEDDSTNFVSSTSVGSLDMNSVGGISDADFATVNVNGVARLFSETEGIRLGDADTDAFNAGFLNVNAGNGIVNIAEDSDLVLTGVNQSRSLVLSAQGSIQDGDLATIDVEFLLDVMGTFVELGDANTDSVGFSSLTFNTSGDTRISSEETIILTGTSVAGGALILESAGNIFDAADAQVTANSAFLTAIDIVLGDSDDDCFDVLPENVVIVASGVANVTAGC